MTSRARRTRHELQALDGLRAMQRDGVVIEDPDGRWRVSRDGVPEDWARSTSMDEIVTALIERRPS